MMAGGESVRTVAAEFTASDLRRIRTLVNAAGVAAGIGVHRVADLVSVVNELAMNAVLYAGGRGRVTITPSAEGLSVQVSDEGPGLPATATGLHRPPPDVPGGRGLWLARQMFPDLSLASSAKGLTVTLFAARPGH